MAGERLNVPLTVPTKLIADVWGCSHRNVKLIIQKLEGKDWILWDSGVGRGNPSRVKLLVSPFSLIENERLHEYKAALLDTNSVGNNKSMSVFGWERRPWETIDILRIPFYRPLGRLSPKNPLRRTNLHFLQLVCNRLVKIEGGRYVGDIALDWFHTKDYTTWTFILRKGVTFHNGKPLEAADVISSYERLQYSYYEPLSQFIKSIRTEGSFEIRFELNEPNPQFLEIVAHPALSIFSEGENNIPMGTGPFRLLQNHLDITILEANDYYFGERPYIDRVEAWVLNRGSYNELHSNEMEGLFHLQNYPFWKEAFVSWKTKERYDPGGKIIFFNEERMDVEVRCQLVNLLQQYRIETDEIRKKGVRIGSLIKLDEETESVEIQENKRFTYNQTITIWTFNGAGNEEDAMALKTFLIRKGIKVILHVVSFEDIHKRESMVEADLVLYEQPVLEARLASYVMVFQSLLSQFLWGNETRHYIQDLVKQSFQKDYIEDSQRTFFLLEKWLIDNGLFLPLYRWKQEVHYPDSLKQVHINDLGWVDYHKVWKINESDMV
ncbi:SgrR family transcriptional regulator [Bacillus carboniphilus]|uniref:SgrR family transcriptional regulator n=1 Tax=Bacillus carboniphilus TaxID=86663 RepID=A0ABP3FP42_9BACI